MKIGSHEDRVFSVRCMGIRELAISYWTAYYYRNHVRIAEYVIFIFGHLFFGDARGF